MNGKFMKKQDTETPDFMATIDELSLWSAPFGLKLLDVIGLKRNMYVLDLGCGLGFPLIELAERLGGSCRAVGLDPWKAALERAGQKCAIRGIENAFMVDGVAEHMPFPGRIFDLIVSNNGVNNVQDMVQTFSECRRVAKPGAQMVLTLNLDGTMVEFYGVFIQVLKERGMEEEIEKIRQHIYAKRRPLDEIRRTLIASGFRVQNEIHESFRLRYADGTAMLNHGMIKNWFAPAWKDLLDTEDVRSVFETVEERLNEQAKTVGGMTLTVPFITMDCS
jgi:arsenite methyltransferase